MFKTFKSAASIIGLVCCFASLAFAQDPAAQQLLKESFACPAGEYQYRKPVNYYLKFIDHYEWRGSQTTLTVHNAYKEMHASLHLDVQENESVTTARFSDLARVSIEEGVNVVIECRAGLECITERVTRSGEAEEPRSMETVEFRACDAATADNMRAGLQALIDANH